ncbi:DUF6512 family protein [Alkalibacter saccharofermentans]|uniref:Uncharacterized protein n=1 Tax=Alkalibacter saccharofermentans DSM 14828 TaxID=1120975 RepID=A0A1M4ZTA7_9FIRM|nr:DUF6512 family protein [Alkalibacter saccharofermentans]SHF21012.1 hypothetical protein SAMN02746064_02132 [Alkalibacter saccharofermentans DSM 14828]
MTSRFGIIKVKYLGMFLIIFLGLIFHELYKSTDIFLLGFFSPVNESKWEHWKMTYSPMVIVAALEYILMKQRVNNYVFSLAVGIAVFQITTFGLIEVYEILFGHGILFVHVITFLVGGVFGQLARYKIMTYTKPSKILFLVGVFYLFVQLTVFLLFTIDPPRMDYFKDSISNTYGIFELR